MSDCEKKRRGAQPGNQNARKHGFYSKRLTPDELQILPIAFGFHGVDEEIAAVRSRMTTILDHSDDAPDALSVATRTLRRLLRIQAGLAGPV